MKLFAKIVNHVQPLMILAENSILDIWRDSEYACGMATRVTAEAVRNFTRECL